MQVRNRNARVHRLSGPAAFIMPVLLVAVLVLSACQPAVMPPGREFRYHDLRALDPVDAPQASLDLLALYMQADAMDVRVRLDLLELALEPDIDLYLTLDVRPGGASHLPLELEPGTAWELLLLLPAEGPPQVLDEALQPVRGAGLRVLRSPVFDHLEIRLNTSLLRQLSTGPLHTLQVQAFTTLPGESAVGDSIGPASIQEKPPRQGQVVLAFWDALPAYSPAETLRRWNGAHTGPSGGRHGLENLLGAVEEAGVPVILLDLLHPASAPALDILGTAAVLRGPMERGLIGAPVVITGAAGSPGSGDIDQWALQRASQDSLLAARRLQLPAGSLAYAPEGDPGLAPQGKVVFVSRPDLPALSVVQGERQGSRLFIPVPGTAPAGGDGVDIAVGMDGPSLAIRTALAQVAQEAQHAQGASPLLLLGGDLPGTDWGSPRVAELNLRYLLSRPWIRILSPTGLLTLEGSRATWAVGEQGLPDTGAGLEAAAMPEDFAPRQQALLEQLRRAPDNHLAQAAWQAYLAAFAPVWPGSPALPAVRYLYFGDVEMLLSAARWAADPRPQAECAFDFNRDGVLDCVLASETAFAVFDAARAGLVLLAVRLPDGEAHQVIGPTSQLISGASDPYTWNFDALGGEVDPEVILGAFMSPAASEATELAQLPAAEPVQALTGAYLIQTAPDVLHFSSNAGWAKTFTLTEAGMRIEYWGEGPFPVQIPLALDPWTRSLPDWHLRYLRSAAPQAWAWGVKGESGTIFWVSIAASEPVRAHTFLDSVGYLPIPEDPNFDYPGGHLLPFPLAVVELDAAGDFVVELTFEAGSQWPAFSEGVR
jgi:hypothetical protein